MSKLDLKAIRQVNRTGYPAPFDAAVQGRWYRRLAPASGLTDFGVRGEVDCVFVVVGGGTAMGGDYPDIDMRFTAGGRYVHDDGTPYDSHPV